MQGRVLRFMAKIKTTAGKYPVAEAKSRWVGILFFIILHAVGLIGTPLYIMQYGVTAGEWTLFLDYYVLKN